MNQVVAWDHVCNLQQTSERVGAPAAVDDGSAPRVPGCSYLRCPGCLPGSWQSPLSTYELYNYEFMRIIDK